MKVRTRLMVVLLAIGIMGLIGLLKFVETRVAPVYSAPLEDALVDISTILSSQLTKKAYDSGHLDLTGFSEGLEHALLRRIDALIHDRLKDHLELHVYVTDEQGIVVFDSQHKLVGQDYSRWRDIHLTLQGEYGARSTWDRERGEPELIFYVASPVKVNGRILGVVSVGKATPQAYSIFQKMRRDALIGVYLAVFLAVGLATLFTLWVTRPIRQLTEYAKAVRDGKPVALPQIGSSDIGMLAQSFDEMREALEGRKYVEQYVQTLTHEIKSPLSAIRGAAELLEEDMPEERRANFMKNIQTESHRIQRIVDRLLELSAIEKRRGLQNSEQLSLAVLMHEIIDSATPLLAARRLSIRIVGDHEPQIKGEKFLLHQALSNLISNAIDFSPEGGVITVHLEKNGICIEDQGPGIPDYAVDRVFDRFYSLQRPQTGKKSSGLGLSIVRRVAELHGAQIILENRKRGGARARLRFVA